MRLNGSKLFNKKRNPYLHQSTFVFKFWVVNLDPTLGPATGVYRSMLELRLLRVGGGSR